MRAQNTTGTKGKSGDSANIEKNSRKIWNSKSGQEVAKHDPKGRRSKTDLRYWPSRVFKNTFTRDGVSEETANYCVRIAYKGRRETFNLDTPNAGTAAEKAQQLYAMIQGAGWDAARAKFKPATVKPAKGSTVGALLRAVAELADVRPATLRGYTATFRRIAAECEGIATDASRYARCGDGREAWLAAVDAVPLAKLTPSRIEAWKLRFVATNGAGDEIKARSARNSANSMLRMGKGLFSKRLLRFITERMELPSPLPFEGVALFPRQSMRYTSTMDVEALLTAASDDLASIDPEAFKAFALCLFGGLRRNEADKLRWRSVDFVAGVIRIEPHSDFAPKAETSLGEIPLDPEVCALLQGLRARDPLAEYVLAADVPKRNFKIPHKAKTHSSLNQTWAKYRAQDTFTRLAHWLRSEGVNTRAPLHTLRKEAGSLICQKAGLFAASRFLRHADVVITAQHYTDQKERVSVGLGGFLKKKTNVVAATFASPSQKDNSAIAKQA